MSHGLGELTDVMEEKNRRVADIRGGLGECLLCTIELDVWLQCQECEMKGHVTCWAREFLATEEKWEEEHLIPVMGKCLFCESLARMGKDDSK